MRTFKTKAGTELPILDLRGKDYLQIAHRIVWFREEHPLWSIETTCVEAAQDHALFKTYIKDEVGRIISTAHKYEDQKGFADFIEKAETGSIGRALAGCGYGTQFAPDIEEGNRLADAPLPKKEPIQKNNSEDIPKFAPPSTQKTRGGLTTAQLKRLVAIQWQVKMPDNILLQMAKNLEIPSKEDMTLKQYEVLCATVENWKP